MHAHRPVGPAGDEPGAVVEQRSRHAEISRLAEDTLADRFRAIDGVANVTGDRLAASASCRCCCTPQKMREFNVSASDVTNAPCQRQNTNAPVGKLRSELDEKGIRLVGRIERPDDFSQIVVKRNGDHHRAPEPGGRHQATASPTSTALFHAQRQAPTSAS